MSGILPRDTYEYLMNFADDRTILNMVRANKQFDNQDFFRRVMERRYPHLLSDKKEGESWKQLYLRTMKYIGLLKEIYDFPYIPIPEFVPEKVYKTIKSSVVGQDKYNIWTYGLRSGNLDLPAEYIYKIANMYDLEELKVILNHLIDSKRENKARYFDLALVYATEAGRLDMVMYVLSIPGYRPYPGHLLAAKTTARENGYEKIAQILETVWENYFGNKK